jgi:hypothetical protein
MDRADYAVLAATILIIIVGELNLLGIGILFNGDSNAAISLLSTIAQSLAALLAISFSILIIVVQFSASKYTPRVVSFSLRSVLLSQRVLIVLTSFVVAILIDFLIVSQINGAALSNEMSRFVSISILLASFCFLLIINLFLHTPEFFDPKDTIEHLKSRAVSEDTRVQPNEFIRMLGDMAKKEVAFGNIDVINLSLTALQEVSAFYIKKSSPQDVSGLYIKRNACYLSAEAIEELSETVEVSILTPFFRIVAQKAVDILQSLCLAAIDQYSECYSGKFGAGGGPFVSLARFGTVTSYDYRTGAIHDWLLEPVVRNLKGIILHIKDEQKKNPKKDYLPYLGRSIPLLLRIGIGYFSKESTDAHNAVDYIIAETKYACSKEEVLLYSEFIVFEHELLNFQKLFFGDDPAKVKDAYIKLLLDRYDAKARSSDVIMYKG